MSEDFYHDDPIEEDSRAKSRSKLITTGVVIVGSIFFLQSTLAGNISLNSGRGIEFGQSVSQTVACSGETSLTLTPRSTFINGSPGAHYLQSVTVSNIPTSCYGDDFIINAYDDSSSTPLALFNSTSTNAVVYNNNGTFELGVGTLSGVSITSGSGIFTITFTNPVALSSTVFKLTIQSGVHAVYKVGEITTQKLLKVARLKGADNAHVFSATGILHLICETGPRECLYPSPHRALLLAINHILAR